MNLFIQQISVPGFEVCIFIKVSWILGEVSETVIIKSIENKYKCLFRWRELDVCVNKDMGEKELYVKGCGVWPCERVWQGQITSVS